MCLDPHQCQRPLRPGPAHELEKTTNSSRRGTAGHLIVADYVLAVYGDVILLAAPRRKLRRSMVHTLGKPLRVVYVTRVLDADAVRVGVPPTGMPGYVLIAHRLRHPAFPADDVVCRRLGSAVLKPAYGA